ncbi:MAG: sugar phosphate isomerase/epimerase [Phycisphaerae bacterium]|nr:sugar phosphate isomerase/epimerase [Phycisphaerae bacterium]
MSSVIAAQLYTVREFTQTPEDIVETMKKVAAMGYEAVQLSAVGPMEPSELREVCDGEGLTVCATHVDYEQMRDEPEIVIEQHQILGCEHTAIGGLPEEYRGADGFARFAREASVVAERLVQGGLTFSYHNHSFELEKFGDRTGLQILYEESDPRYFTAEIDTYWIQHGGGSPVVWIDKLQGRLPLLHLKDMTMQGHEQIMAEVGEGNLDWPGINEAAEKAGCVYAAVEQDTCPGDPFDSLELSYKNLVEMGLS